MHDLPGYELEELLHGSDSSTVHRAKKLADGTSVTIKQTSGTVVSARQFTRYRNEFELLRSLNIDGVSRAYALLQHEGRLALVLEHFPGAPVKKWRAGQAFDLVEALDIAIQVGTTLGRVHAAGVIHKDVTSQNIVYDPVSRRAKLVDFGLATRRTESIDFQHPRALEGTLAYMAPEQTGRMNRSVDHRADLYSFGVTLYELFSGVRPHESDDPLELVHFHIARQPVPLAELDAAIPASVSALVMKLLRKAPEDRYQSAAGVVADLRRCRDEIASGKAGDVFELGCADVIDRFEPPQKLYGREADLSKLLGAFDRAAAGSSELLLVSGRAGIGKTSLVSDIHWPVTTRRGYFAAGKFDQMNRDRPFSALVEALQDLVEQLLTESPEAVEDWREAIRTAVGANGRVLVDVIPALEHITGRQPAVRPLPSVEAVNRFQLVFQSFVQVFARREHPLVLFLDDMQWADAASLNLVTLLLGSPATESLLVVAAYREEEVQPTHPLLLTAKELGGRGVPVGEIELGPLAVPEVVRLLADTLHADAASQEALAGVVHARTGGNPFFIRQFLQSLHEDGLIAFDAASRSFTYDLNAINRTTISENVAEILSSKIHKLDPDTQRALKLAAAIGGRFELSTLAVIHGRPESELADLLEPALETGLIVPASRFESLDPSVLDSPLVYRRFAFLHDRVQRAAYETIAPEERPGLHLEIGRLLLADSEGGEAALERRLFDVINHMNQGMALIETPAERLRLAELNLRAGRRAKDSTAYAAAVRSFQAAVALLGGEQAWSEHYELAWEAHAKLAESLALNARYDEAFEVVDAALMRAESRTGQAELLALKVIAHLSQAQFAEALRCARQGAGILGVDLPADGARLDDVLQAEIARILERTDEIGVDKLLDLPVMQDDEKIALMSLLTHCLPAAFQTDQQLFSLICCKMVSLSLDFGNCPLSARAYGSFGAILSGGLRKYRAAYRFTKLGIDLAHHLDDLSVMSGVHFLHAHFASHWNEPVDASIEIFKRGMQYGLETGDHPHATYSAARRVSHLLFRGMTLPELRDETVAAIELNERVGERTNIPFLVPHLRFVDWLRGERPAGDTLGDARQTEDEHTAAIEALGNFSFESDWFTMLLMHRFFCGEFEKAYEFSLRAEKLLPFSAGFITRSEHGFYSAMTAAAMYDSANAAARPGLKSAIERNRADLARWAENCRENFGHMHELVAAETARLDGETMTAMRLYDRAIASASLQGFAHIEALAAERAARFWREQDKPDFAAHYLDKAIQSYEIWGAAGKAADLRREHGMHARSAVPSSTVSSSVGTTRHGAERGDALDLATMLKASLAIANELILESLLAKLMHIILESAGGESVVLVLESDGRYFVQGVKESAAADPRLMIGEPLPDSTALSPAIANYVIRTGEPAVLADPALRGRFRNDDYVRRHAPKSVLCAPILHKGKLTGLIYLENNQVSGAFTPARLEALTVLLSQIAVSLENATLYARQEEQARRIERANETLKKEVAERKHAEEELSRYKDQLEDLVAQRTRELAAANEDLVKEARARQDALEQLAASNEQVRALAYQDGLTGLPNRRLLNEYLQRTLARSGRKKTEFALLFVDLDNFKLINDTIGHQAADEVLNAFARTLGDLIREDDVLGLYSREVDPDTTVTSVGFTDSVLARLGGDEFVILLPEIRHRFAAGSVANRILQRLERPFVIAGTEAFLATSIGIATYPGDGQTAEELLRNADTAMYHAKQRGKAGYQYYSSEMNAASVERLRIETGLRRALDECQLEVHFQPQLDISSGRLCGAEALLRWREPERGYVPPSTFIPVAEDSALILQLGEWVLNSACAQAVEWQRAGVSPIPVAVNVSGMQFRRQDMCDLARRALALSGLPAECLWLEITETSLMSIQDRAVSLLKELRAMGIRIALDDFGTGYSSLSYLKSLPIDMVKIDRTFVAEALSDARTGSIIEAVIAMTRALGLPVLAEGVETSQQLDFLRRLGCSKAQGHLFSAAVPAESFADFLDSAAQTASQISPVAVSR